MSEKAPFPLGFLLEKSNVLPLKSSMFFFVFYLLRHCEFAQKSFVGKNK